MLRLLETREIIRKPLFVFMSAMGNEQFKEHCLNNGVDYFFEKPLNGNVLKALLVKQKVLQE